MFLAFREIRRAKVRFGLLAAAIGLLVFLILFQVSIQNGLITSFVGAVRNQTAPVLVYSVDGQRTLQSSLIAPPLEATIRGVDGIGSAARLTQGTFSATADGELLDVSLIGFEDPSLGGPARLVAGRLPAAPQEAVASDADADAGFGIGDVVVLQPGGLAITVVGLAAEAQLNAGPTLFVTADAYAGAIRSRNPDAGAPLPNAIALRPADGVGAAELVARVNAASDDADALTNADAAGKAPGVQAVQQSFRVVFLLYGLVVPFVTGLFFLIVTFQKAGALTLLRAIGAPAGRLVSSLLVQVVVVVAAGLVIGIALYYPLSQGRVGSIPINFETGAVVAWSIGLVVAGLVSSLFSAKRVLRIDPVDATHGAGVGK